MRFSTTSATAPSAGAVPHRMPPTRQCRNPGPSWRARRPRSRASVGRPRPPITCRWRRVQEALGFTGASSPRRSIELGDGTNRVRFYPGYGARRSTAAPSGCMRRRAGRHQQPSSRWTRGTSGKVLCRWLRMAAARRAVRLRVDARSGPCGETARGLGAAAIEEKDLVLDLALRIGRAPRGRRPNRGLHAGGRHRPESLDARTATAGVWRADAFVSLHANFAETRQATGPETL